MNKIQYAHRFFHEPNQKFDRTSIGCVRSDIKLGRRYATHSRRLIFPEKILGSGQARPLEVPSNFWYGSQKVDAHTVGSREIYHVLNKAMTTNVTRVFFSTNPPSNRLIMLNSSVCWVVEKNINFRRKKNKLAMKLQTWLNFYVY